MSRHHTQSALALALVAVLCAGCGGTTKTTTQTVAVTTPPAPSTTTTASTTTPASTPAAASVPDAAAPTPTPTTPAAEAKRQDPVTVKGRRGDALTLLGQYATTATGRLKARVKVKVTLKRIRGPFTGYKLPAGHKLIGLDLDIANVGPKLYVDPQPSGTLILAGGETGKATDLITLNGKSPCDNPTLRLKQAQSKSTCVTFDVPKTAKLVSFQYATDSGFGDTALWRLG